MSQDTDHRVDGQARAIEEGWHACATSRYREAESRFEQLRKTSTHSIAGIVGTSAVWRAQGLPIAAEELIRQTLRVSGGDPSLRRELGYIAFERGSLDRSVEIFTELVKSDPRCIKDRRWLAAGLRQAKKYLEARKVLDDAPETSHCGLDLERGLIAYAEGDYANAVEHFRIAKAHGAEPDSYVPPLIRALIRMGKADDAHAEAARVELISSVAVAWAEIKVHEGHPKDAIELMLKLGVRRLDESGLTQLVILLLGAERDAEARDIFREWMSEVSYTDKGLPKDASPAIVSIWIELAAQDPSLTDRELKGRVESALLRYSRPDFVPAAVAVSAIRAMRKIDTAEAERIAKENIEHHVAPVSILIESAITSFLQRHDYKSALQELDRAIRLEPENERALQWRCRSMRRLGHWKQLEKYLSDGNRSINHSASLQAERGWFRITQCEYHKAAEAFSEACRLDPSSQDALFGQVTALRKLQRWHEAKTVLGKWQDQWPDSRRQRLAAALLALDREDFSGSAKLFQKVGGVPGLLGEASVLNRQRCVLDARGKLEAAERKDPARSGPKLALATLLAQENQDESQHEDKNRCEERRQHAEELCCKAMGRGAESDAGALACRAHFAASEGYLRSAESFLREAQQRNPYGGHTVALASILIDMHRIDEAVTMLNEWLTVYPHDSSAYFQLHRALHAQGDAKAALVPLRSALAVATGPGNDPLAVHLAYDLEEHGNSAEAEQLLRTRLAGGGLAKDDHLRLGLAWILLTRGERAQSPALLHEAAKQASQVLEHPDRASATADPEKIQLDALKCRGTAYYKLAEHERNPGERARLVALARFDQRKRQRIFKEKAPRGSRLPAFLTTELDTVLRVVVLLAAFAFTIVLWILHSGNQKEWTGSMVELLTPLLLGIVLLAALLPNLSTLKIAGLEAQTRQPPEVQLPTSPSVALPRVTEFAAAATENFIDAEGIPTLVIHDLAIEIRKLPLPDPPTPR